MARFLLFAIVFILMLSVVSGEEVVVREDFDSPPLNSALEIVKGDSGVYRFHTTGKFEIASMGEPIFVRTKEGISGDYVIVGDFHVGGDRWQVFGVGNVPEPGKVKLGLRMYEEGATQWNAQVFYLDRGGVRHNWIASKLKKKGWSEGDAFTVFHPEKGWARIRIERRAGGYQLTVMNLANKILVQTPWIEDAEGGVDYWISGGSGSRSYLDNLEIRFKKTTPVPTRGAREDTISSQGISGKIKNILSSILDSILKWITE